MKMKTINPENKWETLYRKGIYQGKYPNEDVIRFIQRNFPDVKARKKQRVLDWGVGTGRHTVYLADENFLAYGVEVSAAGVAMTKKWLKKKNLKAEVSTINGITTPFPDNYFDAIIECASLQHNRVDQIKAMIAEMHRILKPGGKVFSWCKSRQDSLYRGGKELEKNTFHIKKNVEIPTIIHFFDDKELKLLWKDFSPVEIEYTERTIGGMKINVAHYIVSATK